MQWSTAECENILFQEQFALKFPTDTVQQS